jgi:hypothetical protein
MINATPLFHRHYAFHDLYVRLGWDDPAVGKWVQTVYEYFGLVAAQTASPKPQVSLDFFTKARALSIPAEAREVARYRNLKGWQAGTQMFLCDGDATMQLDPASGAGVGTLRPSRSHTPHATQKDLLIYSLLILLRYWGLYAMHAACVANNRVGCMFVADCDSGKSTLAFSLVRQGWAYVSDDSILLRPSGGQVEALALRRDLCLDPEAVRYFPDVVPYWRPCPLAEEVKQRLDMQALYPEQAVLSCMPRVLIFPHIVAEPTSQLRPLGKAAALLRLIRQSALVVVEPHMAPGHLEVLKRLVNQTRSYELFAGQDLGSDPALISRLLSGIGVQQHSPEGI